MSSFLRLSSRLLQAQRRPPWKRTATSAAASAGQAADYRPGQSLPHHWTVLGVQPLPELDVTAVHLSHAHCPAQLIHLSSPSDPVNAFSVNFRTVPADSTGISHILEHVTLCGSERYPVRDPFFKMLNRSLSTFMNAMTGPDYTLYPFCTPNNQDYYNLLSVYLDAVFRPKLAEQDFRQEGWRLEPRDLADASSPPIIKGVVFNEMKGVFADSQQLFYRRLLSAVLPTNTYGHCSGGLPENIPDLTYDDLRAFHARHYSPHNAKFFTYGSLPLEGHLEAIARYLPEQKESKDTVAYVPSEVKWTSPRSLDITCAPDPAAPESSTMAVSYLACDINDEFEVFVLGILDDLLLDGSNAPFYKSLLESGLGSSFGPVSGFASHTKDTFFSLGLQGFAIENKQKVVDAIESTLAAVVRDGFEQDRIDAILHQTELSLKNRSNNFGLNLIMALTTPWNHTDDPVKSLQINAKVERFRQEMKNNPRFLQDKVEQYFLKNQHKLTMTMSPRSEFVEEQQAVLDDIEQKLVSGLTDSRKKELHEQGVRLAAAQDQKEDLECLPSLKLADIPRRLPVYEVQQLDGAPVPTQLSVQPTNEVAFFRALVNIESLPEHLRDALPLFSSVLSSLGAGQFDFRRLDTEVNLRTAGLSAGIHLSEMPSGLTEMRSGLLLSSHCLERNADRMFELWTAIFNDFHHDKNPDRLKTLITMMATDAMNGLAYSGHSYAMGSSAASLQAGASLRENYGGMGNLRRLNRLSQAESHDETIDKLGQIAKHLLNKNNMRVALNTTAKHADEFVRSTERFLQSVPGQYSSYDLMGVSDFEAAASKKYFTTPFPVHFCSQSLPTVHFEHEDYPALRIMAHMVSRKFLHTEIREKGGAYGSGLTTSSAGVLTFFSYRDPNSTATLDTFDRASEWVKSNQFSEQDLDEAKLGVFQKLDEPVLPGARGLLAFLSDVDDQMLHEHRTKLREVTRDDVLRVNEKYLSASATSPKGVAIIGPEPSNLDASWTVEKLV